jgi:hypothetical protein
VPVKKIFYDLYRALFLFIAFFAIIGKQGKQDACFFNPVKRE